MSGGQTEKNRFAGSRSGGVGVGILLYTYNVLSLHFLLASGDTLQQYAWLCSINDQNTKRLATLMHITLFAKIDTDAWY